MTSIMPAFQQFPQEGAAIGRLLAGYGELELGLCFCVASVRADFNGVFKAMFRCRGETQRIDIGDALGRASFHDLGHGTLFEESIGDMRFCLKIRNQYAHCYWTDDYGRQLGFVELEETAKSNRDVSNVYHVKAKDIDSSTLERQEQFFVRTARCLTYLNKEAQTQAGVLTSHGFQVPGKVPRPPLCKP